MKTKLMRILAIGLSTLFILGGLLACGQKDTATTKTESNGQTGGNKTKISYYGGWTGADLEKMQALVKSFNTSQDKIEVEFSSEQWSKMFTKFLADYQAGASPDVVAMHTFEIGQFAAMDVLDTDIVAGMGLKKDDYLPIAWDGCMLNDKLYGVPLDVNMHAVYYNTDLFKAAGVSAFPKDKAAFIETAQKLTLDENGKNALDPSFNSGAIKQYGLGFGMNHHAFYQLYALMNQEGYNPFTADMSSIKLDASKMSEAIQYMEDLIFKYHVVPVGEKSAMDDFKAGKVAMCVDGNWQLSGLSSVSFKWDTAEYPQIFSEKAVWGAAELLTFPKQKNPDKEKQDAAKIFVKWLAENSKDWALSGQIPANKKAYQEATKLPGIAAFEAELDYVKFLPAHAKATQIFSSVAPSPILTAAQDMVLNHLEPAKIIQTLESDINAVLSK